MAIIKDPPPWSKEEQRDLVRVLGPGCAPVLRDLAWVRFHKMRWKKAIAEANRRRERDGTAAAMRRDYQTLRALGMTLRRARREHQRLSAWCREDLDPLIDGNLDRLEAAVAALQEKPENARGRGRPQGDARRIAAGVGAVLHTHGVRLTHGPDGRFARVLALVLASLNLDADVDGLVRATIAARRT